RRESSSAPLLAVTAEEAADIRGFAEVVQLVRVDHGPDRLYEAVGDVERDHVDDPPFGVEHESSGLSVDLVPLQGDPQLPELAAPAGEQTAAPPAPDPRWG